MLVKVLTTILLYLVNCANCGYMCHPSGISYLCCENDGVGPICKRDETQTPCQRNSRSDVPVTTCNPFSDGTDYSLRTKPYTWPSYRFVVNKVEAGKVLINKYVEKTRTWIDCTSDNCLRVWSCQINLRDSPDVTTCNRDASAYGEANILSQATMNTNLVYDEEFCMKCKATGTFLQSDFFRVKVGSDCSGIDCSSAQGQFIEFVNYIDDPKYKQGIINKYSQFFKIKENEIPIYTPMKFFYTNHCCFDAEIPGAGIKYQLSQSNTNQVDLPGLTNPIYDPSPGDFQEQLQVSFQVDSSLKYVPDIYNFFIHASTLSVDFFWPLELRLYVVCGDEDPTLPLPQPGRTSIMVKDPAPDPIQYIPSLEQATGTYTNPSWRQVLPFFVSSNQNDCKIQKITTSKILLPWNTAYSNDNWQADNYLEDIITDPGSNVNYAELQPKNYNIQRYSFKPNLVFHLGRTLQKSMYYMNQMFYDTTYQQLSTGCYNIYKSNFKISVSIFKNRSTIGTVQYPDVFETLLINYNSVTKIPIGARIVYKYYFPEYLVDFCQHRKDPFFLEISNVYWWDEQNIYGQDIYCTDEQARAQLPSRNVRGFNGKLGKDKTCWTSVNSQTPFLNEPYLFLDQDGCTNTYCPIVFARNQTFKAEPLWMDHDPSKYITIQFELRTYIETLQSNNNYRVDIIQIKNIACNEYVDYHITSSLHDTTLEERTFSIYLDEIKNGRRVLYEFDNYDCEPSDCCLLDYSVVNDKNPLAVVLTDEAEILKDLSTGKNQLIFKNDSYLQEKTYYIFARTSIRSTNIDETFNMKDQNATQYFGISFKTSCDPKKSELEEGSYPGNLSNIQETQSGEKAYFILSNLQTKDSRCKIIKMEALDKNNNPITNLRIQQAEQRVIPTNPNLKEEYNFIVRVTVDGGKKILTTTKTLRAGFIEKSVEVQNSFSNLTLSNITQTLYQAIEVIAIPTTEEIEEIYKAKLLENYYKTQVSTREYQEAKKISCAEALKFVHSTDQRIKDGQIYHMKISISLSQQINTINKFEIKYNLDWPFKSECRGIKLLKLCIDWKCFAQLNDARVQLKQEQLMIDRSKLMKQVVYLQVENTKTYEWYTASVYVEVLERYYPEDLQVRFTSFSSEFLNGTQQSIDANKTDVVQGKGNNGKIQDNENLSILLNLNETQQNKNKSLNETSVNENQTNAIKASNISLENKNTTLKLKNIQTSQNQTELYQEELNADQQQLEQLNSNQNQNGSSQLNLQYKRVNDAYKVNQNQQEQNQNNNNNNLKEFDKAPEQVLKTKSTEKIPVLIKLQSINNEGVAAIAFNQNIKQIFSEISEKDGKRILISFQFDIKLQQIFIFELLRDGLNVTSTINDVLVVDQKAQEIKLKFVFQKVESISSGYKKDKLTIKINPDAKQYFKSQNSDLVLQDEKEMVIEVPQQITFNMTQEQIQQLVTEVKDSFTAAVIVQIGVQLYLKRSIQDMITMFMVLQIIETMKYMQFQQPVLVEVLLNELSITINFENVSPNYFLGLYKPGLTLKTLFMNEVDRFNAQKLSLMPDFLILIILSVVLLSIFIILYYVISRLSERVPKEKVYRFVQNQKKKYIWNRIILTFFMNYTFQCMRAVQLIQLGDYKIPILTYVFLLVKILAQTQFLRANIGKLEHESFKKKYEQLYQDVTMQRNRKRVVLYYPIFFFRRWVIMLIPLIGMEDSGLQINFLLYINLLGIIAYGWMRSHNSLGRQNLEFFNDSLFIMLIYSMICMTTFNLDRKSQFYSGFIFIAIILLIMLGNLSYQLVRNRVKYNQQKIIQKLKQQQQRRIQYLNEQKEEFQARMFKKLQKTRNVVQKAKNKYTGQKAEVSIHNESTESLSVIDETLQESSQQDESSSDQSPKDKSLQNSIGPLFPIQISFGDFQQEESIEEAYGQKFKQSQEISKLEETYLNKEESISISSPLKQDPEFLRELAKQVMQERFRNLEMIIKQKYEVKKQDTLLIRDERTQYRLESSESTFSEIQQDLRVVIKHHQHEITQMIPIKSQKSLNDHPQKIITKVQPEKVSKVQDSEIPIYDALSRVEKMKKQLIEMKDAVRKRQKENSQQAPKEISIKQQIKPPPILETRKVVLEIINEQTSEVSTYEAKLSYYKQEFENEKTNKKIEHEIEKLKNKEQEMDQKFDKEMHKLKNEKQFVVKQAFHDFKFLDPKLQAIVDEVNDELAEKKLEEYIRKFKQTYSKPKILIEKK